MGSATTVVESSPSWQPKLAPVKQRTRPTKARIVSTMAPEPFRATETRTRNHQGLLGNLRAVGIEVVVEALSADLRVVRGVAKRSCRPEQSQCDSNLRSAKELRPSASHEQKLRFSNRPEEATFIHRFRVCGPGFEALTPIAPTYGSCRGE